MTDVAAAWPASTSFVGRAGPLAAVRRCLDEALRGRPRVVLVEGEAGIGKSRLADEMLAVARQQGALVLVGRCGEDLSVPYFPIASALAPLGDELGAASTLVDQGATGPVDLLAAFDDRPAAPLIAACQAAVRVARRRPVVLLIEDLHWADRHTLRLFEQLVATTLDAGAAGSIAILVAATMRPPANEVAVTVERLLRGGAVRTVALAGMDEIEVNALLTALAPARPSRALLAAVADAAGGNPLLVRTVLGRLLETGGVAVRRGELVSTGGELLSLPGGLDAELRRRVDRVNAACVDLLTRAAFLGDGGSLADLAVAAAPATDGFDDLLDEAEAAGLIHDDGERYRFDHPQLRQILYHEPSGRRRRRLHLALADQLEERYGDDPGRAIEIADHLRRAGPSVDPTRLATRCAAAGEHALAMGAWGAAARFFDDAIAAQRPADERERARLALRAGLGHFRDHDLPTAEPRLLEAVAAARAAGDLDLWAAAALLVTRAWMTIGPDSVGALIDTSVLEELRADPRLDARRAGEVAGLLAEVHFHAFDFERGASLLDEARLLAARHGDDALATSVELAAGLQHLGRLELDQAAACFHASAGHARLLADPWQRVWGLGRLPLVEVMLGELGAAAAHAAEAAGIAAANHDWAEHALASACAVQVATARGEFAAAEAAGVVAQQMQLRSDFAMVPLLLYPALAATRATRGDAAGADAALDDWAAAGGRGLAPHRLLTIAAAHDPTALAAARPFRPVGARPADLFTLPVLCAQAEIAVVSGDVALLTDAVEPLMAVHAAGVRWCLGWPLLVARLLAGACRVLGRLDEADHWCDVAAADADRGGARGEQARIGLERALLAEARGAPDSGRAAATDAAAALDRCGMLPLAQVARRRAGIAGGLVRTILFTDLVGSTELNVRRGDAEYLEILREHNTILRTWIRRFDGVEIKHTGDGIASWFASAPAACECALAARDALADHNVGHPDAPLVVRFGLASGSPIAHEGDFFGVTVSLAARLCAAAAPGQVLVSQDVAAAAAGGRLTFRGNDPIELKGFPEPMRTFAVAAAIE